MKMAYEKLVLDIVYMDADIVRTSPGGWWEGDNDINWDNFDNAQG